MNNPMIMSLIKYGVQFTQISSGQFYPQNPNILFLYQKALSVSISDYNVGCLINIKYREMIAGNTIWERDTE